MITVFDGLTKPQGELRPEFDFEPVMLEDKKSGKLYAPVVFDNNHRSTDSALRAHGCVIDFDNSATSQTVYREIKFEISDIEHIAYSSFSNSKEWPKWHLYVPFANEISPFAFGTAVKELFGILGMPGGIDVACTQVARAYFAPSYSKKNKALSFCIKHPGKRFEPELGVISEGIEYIDKADIKQGRNTRLGKFVTKLFYDGFDFNDVVEEALRYDRQLLEKRYFTDPKEFPITAELERLNAINFCASHAKTLRKNIKSSLQVPLRARKSVILDKTPNEFSHEYSYFDQEFINRTPGLVGDIAQDILANAKYPQPALALQAALCLVATLKAHLVRLEDDTRTNLFTIGTATTGMGKNDPQRYVNYMLTACGIPETSPGFIRSFAGLYTALIESHCKTILIWDEFGLDLQKMLNPKAAGWELQIQKELNRIYSGAADSFSPGKTGISRDKEQDPRFHQPNLCVAGFTTPSTLFDAFNGSNIKNGFVPRFMYFKCQGAVRCNFNAKCLKPRDDIFKRCCDYAQHALSYMQKVGAASKTTKDIGPQEKPPVVDYEDSARFFLEDFTLEMDLLKQSPDVIKSEIHTRVTENTKRVALTICNDSIVTLDDAKFASELVLMGARNLFLDIKHNMSDSPFAEQIKQVKEILSRKIQVKRAELSKDTNLTPQKMNTVLAFLSDCDLIKTKSIKNRNGKVSELITYTGGK